VHKKLWPLDLVAPLKFDCSPLCNPQRTKLHVWLWNQSWVPSQAVKNHRWGGIIEIPKIHTNVELAILFHYRNNVDYPCWVFHLANESSFYEFVYLLFDLGYHLREKTSLWLLFRWHVFSNGQAMDNNLRIQSKHLLVALCKHIFILAKKIKVLFLFFMCEQRANIYRAWLLYSTKIWLFEFINYGLIPSARVPRVF